MADGDISFTLLVDAGPATTLVINGTGSVAGGAASSAGTPSIGSPGTAVTSGRP